MHHFRPKCGAFSLLHHNLCKVANFAGLYFPDLILHFATKFCNFTNFKILYLAVVMDFDQVLA